MARKGIVRLTRLELADQKRSRLSRGKLSPLSQSGNAVELEGLAAVNAGDKMHRAVGVKMHQ